MIVTKSADTTTEMETIITIKLIVVVEEESNHSSKTKIL